MEYGDVPLAPVIWMDDIMNGTEGLDQARQTNKKIDFLLKTKGFVTKLGQIRLHCNWF